MTQQRKRDKRLTVVSRRKPWDAAPIAKAVAQHINEQLLAESVRPTAGTEAAQ